MSRIAGRTGRAWDDRKEPHPQSILYQASDRGGQTHLLGLRLDRPQMGVTLSVTAGGASNVLGLYPEDARELARRLTRMADLSEAWQI